MLRKKLFSWRYSLGSAFLTLTIACLFSGWWTNESQVQRKATRCLLNLNEERESYGWITVQYRMGPDSQHLPALPPACRRLGDLVGQEHFATIVGVQMINSLATDEDLLHLQALPDVEKLWLSGTDVTDRGLAQLRSCQQLQHLELDQTRIKGPGLAHLAALPRLHHLSLKGTRLSEGSVEALHQLTQLRSLALERTGLSDAAVQQLRRGLPKCRISPEPSASP